jgi:hypothetical protein
MWSLPSVGDLTALRNKEYTMVNTDHSADRPTTLAYVACYALYAMLIALGIVDIVLIWRRTVLALLEAFMRQNTANRLIYLASMALLGLAVFILIMAAEPYLRNGVRRHDLLRRFIRLAVPLVVVGAVGILLMALV